MIYAVMGFLTADAEDRLEALAGEFNEHLAQPFRRVRLAGALCGGDGRREGYMALIEADDREAAEAYLRESPLFRAGLYARTEVLEYRIELGTL